MAIHFESQALLMEKEKEFQKEGLKLKKNAKQLWLN